MNPSDSTTRTLPSQFHEQFFNQLQPTGKRGTCPKCGAKGLEIRITGPRGERYLNHCGSVQSVLTGDRLKVALALGADANRQAEIRRLEIAAQRVTEAAAELVASVTAAVRWVKAQKGE